MANPFAGYDNVVCFLAPQDIASTATDCPYVDLRNAQKAFFLLQFGAVTSTTCVDVVWRPRESVSTASTT